MNPCCFLFSWRSHCHLTARIPLSCCPTGRLNGLRSSQRGNAVEGWEEATMSSADRAFWSGYSGENKGDQFVRSGSGNYSASVMNSRSFDQWRLSTVWPVQQSKGSRKIKEEGIIFRERDHGKAPSIHGLVPQEWNTAIDDAQPPDQCEQGQN